MNPAQAYFYVCKYCKKGFREPGRLVNHKKQFHPAELVRDKKQIPKRTEVVAGQSSNLISASTALPYPSVTVVEPSAANLLKRSPTPQLMVPKQASPVVSAAAVNVPTSVIAAQKVSTPSGNMPAVYKPTTVAVPSVSISPVSTFTVFPTLSAPIHLVYACAAAASNFAISAANPGFDTSEVILIPAWTIPNVVPPLVSGLSSLPLLAPKSPVPDVSISNSVVPISLPTPNGNISVVSTSKGSASKSVTHPAPLIPVMAVVAPTRVAGTEIPSKVPTPSENVKSESNGNEDDRDGNISTASASTRYSPDSILSEQKIPAQEKVLINCARCSKTFKYRQSFIKHQHSIHNLTTSQNVVKAKADSMSSSNVQSWPCSFCPKAFRLKRTRKVHERIHTGERPFKCSQCPRAFTQSHACKEHMRLHTGEKPHSCSYCSKRFSHKSSHNNHVKICMKRNLNRVHELQRRQERTPNTQQPESGFSKTKGYASNNNNNSNDGCLKARRTHQVSLLATHKPVEIAPGITQLLNAGIIVEYICNACKASFDFRVDANDHATGHINN